MESAFKMMGYKVRTSELSDFHDDYGLQTGEDDEEEEEDEEDEEEYDGSEGSDDDSEED
jgi:hypothetical protein